MQPCRQTPHPAGYTVTCICDAYVTPSDFVTGPDKACVQKNYNNNSKSNQVLSSSGELPLEFLVSRSLLGGVGGAPPGPGGSGLGPGATAAAEPLSPPPSSPIMVTRTGGAGET